MILQFQPNDMGIEITSCWDSIPTPFDLDKEVMPEDENYFTAPFNRGRLEQYVCSSVISFNNCLFSEVFMQFSVPIHIAFLKIIENCISALRW